MAKSYKILGQAALNAATEVTLYTVPANGQFVASHVSVCNRDPDVPTKVRISIAPAAGAVALHNFLVYDLMVPPGKTVQLAKGMCGAAGSVVKVQASTATASFTLFGVEDIEVG